MRWWVWKVFVVTEWEWMVGCGRGLVWWLGGRGWVFVLAVGVFWWLVGWLVGLVTGFFRSWMVSWGFVF